MVNSCPIEKDTLTSMSPPSTWIVLCPTYCPRTLPTYNGGQDGKMLDQDQLLYIVPWMLLMIQLPQVKASSIRLSPRTKGSVSSHTKLSPARTRVGIMLLLGDLSARVCPSLRCHEDIPCCPSFHICMNCICISPMFWKGQNIPRAPRVLYVNVAISFLFD